MMRNEAAIYSITRRSQKSFAFARMRRRLLLLYADTIVDSFVVGIVPRRTVS